MSSSTSSSKRLIGVFAAALLSVLAIIAGASEWLVRTKAAPQDSFQKHVAFFQQASSPYAAFGDSHVARNFDAQAPVVNLAYPSENIKKIKWKLDHYLQHTPNPKIVLLQADPHLFAGYRAQASTDDYRQAFGEASTPLLMAFRARYRPQLVALWRAYIENGGRLVSGVETTAQGALLSPGDLSAWPQARVEQYSKERVTLHRPASGFENSGDAAMYRDMVSGLTARGAKVCLVAFPLSPAYRREMATLSANDRAQFEAADAYYRRLAAAPGVFYIDHRTEYTDPALFRDPDHLNKQGAMAYGPIVQKACFGDPDDAGDQIAAAH